MHLKFVVLGYGLEKNITILNLLCFHYLKNLGNCLLDPGQVSLDPGVYGVLGRVVGLVLSRPGMRREGSALLLKPEHQIRSVQRSSAQLPQSHLEMTPVRTASL